VGRWRASRLCVFHRRLKTTINTKYFFKVYEKIKQNTNTEHKHFIYLDKQLIAIHIKTDTTSGHAAIGIIGVGSVLVVGMGF
jgi:hypothetical protein